MKTHLLALDDSQLVLLVNALQFAALGACSNPPVSEMLAGAQALESVPGGVWKETRDALFEEMETVDESKFTAIKSDYLIGFAETPQHDFSKLNFD